MTEPRIREIWRCSACHGEGYHEPDCSLRAKNMILNEPVLYVVVDDLTHPDVLSALRRGYTAACNEDRFMQVASLGTWLTQGLRGVQKTLRSNGEQVNDG